MCIRDRYWSFRQGCCGIGHSSTATQGPYWRGGNATRPIMSRFAYTRAGSVILSHPLETSKGYHDTKASQAAYKPGEPSPKSLMPVISKVFEHLLHGQITPLLDNFIRQEQFGFRRQHSTTLQPVSYTHLDVYKRQQVDPLFVNHTTIIFNFYV